MEGLGSRLTRMTDSEEKRERVFGRDLFGQSLGIL